MFDGLHYTLGMAVAVDIWGLNVIFRYGCWIRHWRVNFYILSLAVVVDDALGVKYYILGLAVVLDVEGLLLYQGENEVNKSRFVLRSSFLHGIWVGVGLQKTVEGT